MAGAIYRFMSYYEEWRESQPHGMTGAELEREIEHLGEAITRYARAVIREELKGERDAT